MRASGKRLACFLAHSSCVYDGVKIYSLASGEAVLAALCGSSVPGPVLTFGPMLLHFYSDSVLTDAGFMAEYRAIRKFPTRACSDSVLGGRVSSVSRCVFLFPRTAQMKAGRSLGSFLCTLWLLWLLQL